MKYKEKTNRISHLVQIFTLKSITKILLFITLSSFSFSKNIYMALGVDDNEIKYSARHYMYKALYGSIETRLSNLNHSASAGVGVKFGKYDISTHYTLGNGTFPVDGISYTEYDMRLKRHLFELLGLKFHIAIENKRRFYNKRLYDYVYTNVGIYKKINDNFYIDILYQANITRAPRSPGNDISSSFMLGYIYKY